MFEDRQAAGEKLALRLKERIKEKGVVLGVPRGGVVTAKVIAEILDWPLDVLVTKKIGFPSQSELAMGAVAEEGEPVWDERLIKRVNEREKKEELEKAQEKVKRYIKEFRDGRRLEVKGKVVIVVDDGVATGMTLEAGVRWLRSQGVKKIIAAVPVCAKDTAKRLRELVGEWVCLETSGNFMAVGQFYRKFSQVGDEEVKRILVE